MTTVISVCFRNGTKTYYFDPRDLVVSAGDDVIVETAQGLEFARCVHGNHQVEDTQVVSPLRTVLRLATENDRNTDAYNRTREKEAFDICEKKIAAHQLEMKLVRSECSFDGSKILFFFTADGRVDFRELVRDLAGVLRSRIELRQIGVRDEAKLLGGLGVCGRPFCCTQFMENYVPVSIKMAKTQNLSLNPTKISGTCGRLMCCLNYEQSAYEDAIKRLPKNDSFVLTPDGPGNVTDVNVLRELVRVKLDERQEPPHCYHNCEVCVLRNGKGSRDGIVIPDRRPERYVEPQKEPFDSDFSDLTAYPDLSDPVPSQPAPAEKGGEKSRRRRGGRNRRPSGAETKTDIAAEQKAAPAAEKNAEKPAANNGARRRRHNGAKANDAEKATSAANNSANNTNNTNNTNNSANAPKKRFYRGGRRRRGGGDKPKGEA